MNPLVVLGALALLVIWGKSRGPQGVTYTPTSVALPTVTTQNSDGTSTSVLSTTHPDGSRTDVSITVQPDGLTGTAVEVTTHADGTQTTRTAPAIIEHSGYYDPATNLWVETGPAQTSTTTTAPLDAHGTDKVFTVDSDGTFHLGPTNTGVAGRMAGAVPIDTSLGESSAGANSSLYSGIDIKSVWLDARHTLDNFRASFCDLTDAQGRVMFSPMILTFFVKNDQASWDDWFARWRARGANAVYVAPQISYPGFPDSADVRTNPGAWRLFLGAVLNEGMTPLCFMAEGGGTQGTDEFTRYWPGLYDAMKDLWDHVLTIPSGWEPENASYTYNAITYARQYAPQQIAGYHTLQERFTGCSGNPVQADDPWKGDESGFWKGFGGEWLQFCAYQTYNGTRRDVKLPTGRFIGYAVPNPDDPSVYLPPFPDDIDNWMNRWNEGVPRLGLGQRGWKVVPLIFAENVAWNFTHAGGNYSPSGAETAAYALACFQAHGVPPRLGNGLTGAAATVTTSVPSPRVPLPPPLPTVPDDPDVPVETDAPYVPPVVLDAPDDIPVIVDGPSTGESPYVPPRYEPPPPTPLPWVSPVPVVSPPVTPPPPYAPPADAPSTGDAPGGGNTPGAPTPRPGDDVPFGNVEDSFTGKEFNS